MAVLANLGRYSSIAGRWIFIRLVRTCSFLLRFAGVRALAGAFRLLAHLPIVRMLVVPVWRRVLVNAGYRAGAAEWLQWVVQRWPQPRYQVLCAQTSMDARQFGAVAELLRKAKASLVAHPRNASLYLDIVNMEAMLAIENGAIVPDIVLFAEGRGPSIAEYCYQRAWDAHSVTDGRGTWRFLEYYFRAVNYDPDSVFYVSDLLIPPNSLWDRLVETLDRMEKRVAADRAIVDGGPPGSSSVLERLDAVFQMTFRRRRKEDFLTGIYARLVRAYIEMGCFDSAAATLRKLRPENPHCGLLQGLIYLHDPSEASAKGRELLIEAYGNKKLSNQERCTIAGEIAVSFEEEWQFEAARHFYVSSYCAGNVPYYLPEYLWRYVSLCMAQGDYGEAALVLRAGLRVSWRPFHRLARMPIEKRLKRNRFIPPRGAFFLGCMGIGDDIIRIGMFTALHDVTQGPKFGFSVDPRMLSVYQRSFPQYEFVAISRRYGRFGMSEEEYVRLRDGVPRYLDRGRLDINVLKAIRRYGELVLTEDMLVAFVQAGPAICRPDKPMLAVMPEKVGAAREWLRTLPPGLNVGISWRSGQRDVMRSKSYTDLVRDWESVLTVAGVNFVNLQYSWEGEELQEAQARHNCTIYMMPNVDLKDDIEEILALATCLDVVIAPGTTVRDMCAAVGAEVWALSTTPVLPDLWRVQEDGQRDRLFPSMKHFTSYQYGGVDEVLKEVGRRLGVLAGERATVTP